MIDITPILQAIIAVAAVLITYYGIPLIKAKAKEATATAEAAADKLATIATLVQIGVAAAEQLYNSGQGTEKKNYVLDYLASKGFTLDDEAIAADVDVLIESAVYQLKNV